MVYPHSPAGNTLGSRAATPCPTCAPFRGRAGQHRHGHHIPAVRPVDRLIAASRAMTADEIARVRDHLAGRMLINELEHFLAESASLASRRAKGTNDAQR